MKNGRLRVLSICGTRPELIKMAPVIKELSRRDAQFESLLCVTAQHREMLDQMLETFELKPDYDLDLMQPNQGILQVTQGALGGTMQILADSHPDVALVHGDTTTAFASALACFYSGIAVGHVEAGLRSHDKREPFPEEMNRRLADTLCDIHYAPTTNNRTTLLNEGIPQDGIVVTGNTVVDALLSVLPKARELADPVPALRDIDWQRTRPILVTCHRRESFGTRLQGICGALKQIAEEFPDVCVIYPVHPNPNVRGPVTEMLQGVDRVHLIEPVEYLPFVWLMDRAHLILTDSGGIQEEAPSLDKPVLVMRDKTERPEATQSGAVRLIGTKPDDIAGQARTVLQDDAAYAAMARSSNPYGDGQAAVRIADDLWTRFAEDQRIVPS